MVAMLEDRAIEALNKITKSQQAFGFLNGYMLGVIGSLEVLKYEGHAGQKAAEIIEDRLPRLAARLYDLDEESIRASMKAAK